MDQQHQLTVRKSGRRRPHHDPGDDLCGVQVPCVVTVGFYDAGSGVAGLPNSDECFVTVTPNRANWIGQVAPIGSAQAAKLFMTLVLLCAHDCGMNAMQYCNTILSNAESVAEVATVIIATISVVGATIVAAVVVRLL